LRHVIVNNQNWTIFLCLGIPRIEKLFERTISGYNIQIG
jgi:hypothetical protein